MDAGEEEDGGPCKLLFVSRKNLPLIVKLVAPELTLVERRKFEAIAQAMLEVVEEAAETVTM